MQSVDEHTVITLFNQANGTNLNNESRRAATQQLISIQSSSGYPSSTSSHPAALNFPLCTHALTASLSIAPNMAVLPTRLAPRDRADPVQEPRGGQLQANRECAGEGALQKAPADHVSQ